MKLLWLGSESAWPSRCPRSRGWSLGRLTAPKAQAAFVNGHYNVDGLCKDFPPRLDAVIAKYGDRIFK